MKTQELETAIWRIEEDILIPLDKFELEVVKGETKYPNGAEELEISLWNSSVVRKKEDLEGKGLLTTLKEAEGRKALWAKRSGDETFQMTMVPGKQYRLIRVDSPRTLVLELVWFSEGEATKSDDYRKLFTDAGMSLPVGPLAPVLWIQTADGFVIGTVRGTGTPKYPGAIWGVGGDVDNPAIRTGLEEHLRTKEAKEELVIPEGLKDMISVGIIFDKVLWKHELVVHARTPSRFDEIKKGEGYLPDVESITRIPASYDGLKELLLRDFTTNTAPDGNHWRGHLTAGAHAGLFLIGRYTSGNPEFSSDVFRSLKQNQ